MIHKSNGLDDVIWIGRRCITRYLGTLRVKSYNSSWKHWKRLFVISWEYTEPYLSLRGNACLVETSKFVEWRLLIAQKCAELRLPVAWKCVELRPAIAWKCTKPWLAWGCKLRGRLQTAALVRGTRVGSAREVWLKWGSSAWNRGPTHWWVLYLYGTGTLSVNMNHWCYRCAFLSCLCHKWVKVYTNWWSGMQELIYRLTHCGLVMPCGDTDLGQHWLK